MPLKKGSSKEVVEANIKELIAAGHSPQQAAAIAYREAGMAHDALAFDYQSVRRKDIDGRLHVALSPISKANVCPYFGREIPNFQAMGLDPDHVYNLLRDPVELAKAAASFNNVPLMAVHVVSTANDPQKEYVVGATGTDARFEPPYLYNSLVIWDGDAIASIESNEQRELSSSYRYDADMTPGVFEGEPYDGRMTNIIGNHVALVEKGRAGADVLVSDSLPPEIDSMKHKRRQVAVAVRAALSTHLRPLLAADGAIPQLNVLMQGNKSPEQIAKDTKTLFPDKVDEAALSKVLKLAADEAADLPADPDKADDEDETDEEKAAREKKEAADKAKDKKARDKAKDEDEEDEDDKEAAKAKDEEDKKAAMDAAIKVATENAVKAATANAQAIRKAEREVQPLVGEIAAMDSAEAVYRFALDSAGVDNQGVHASALPALIKMAVQSKSAVTPRVAADSAAADDFRKRFPTASPIARI